MAPVLLCFVGAAATWHMRFVGVWRLWIGVDMAGCGGAMGHGQLGSYVNCVVRRMGAHFYNLDRDCNLGRQ